MGALGYRPEIDGLRAIAVAAVVIYHAAPALMPGGFVGVDVFFVVSGYLITVLLLGEWRTTGRIDFPAFYARRARRLLPALLAVVVAVLVANLVWLGRHGDAFERTSASASAAMLFVANIYFQVQAGGYLTAPVEGTLLLHLWSLSVEEQFYFVYPMLLLALLRLFPGAIGRRLALLGLASLLLAEYWVHILPERAFYQMPARLWEFVAGGLVALAPLPAKPTWLDRVLMPVGLVLVLSACLMTSSHHAFPGFGALPAVTGTALALLAIQRGSTEGLFARGLRSPPLVGLGLVSYSLYLWHWPLLALDHNLRLDPASTAWRLQLCMLALVLAWLSWRFIEQPFRGRHNAAPGKVLRLSVASAALVALLAAGLSRVDLVPTESRLLAEGASADRTQLAVGCHLSTGDEPTAAPNHCWSAPGKPPSHVHWGDSHAHAWRSFAVALADARHTSTLGFTMDSCAPLLGPGSDRHAAQSEACERHNELAIEWILRHQVDTVVLAARWPRSRGADGQPSAALTSYLQRFAQTVQRLGNVRRVVVLGPIPELRHPAPACLSSGRTEQCAPTLEEHRAQTVVVRHALNVIAARAGNVRVVDPEQFFCGQRRCRVVRDGYSLYWDDNHVSASAAGRFAEHFLANESLYAPGEAPPGPAPWSEP